MADAVEIQKVEAEQQEMKHERDELRSLLEQRMGPEEAAQYKPKHLDSLVRAGLMTANIIRRSDWQVLEEIGLPVWQILTLGEFFDIPGDPQAPPGRISNSLNAAMVLTTKL